MPAVRAKRSTESRSPTRCATATRCWRGPARCGCRCRLRAARRAGRRGSASRAAGWTRRRARRRVGDLLGGERRELVDHGTASGRLALALGGKTDQVDDESRGEQPGGAGAAVRVEVGVEDVALSERDLEVDPLAFPEAGVEQGPSSALTGQRVDLARRRRRPATRRERVQIAEDAPMSDSSSSPAGARGGWGPCR